MRIRTKMVWILNTGMAQIRRADYTHYKSFDLTNIWSGSKSKRSGSKADMRRSAESWMQTCVNQPNLECRHASISRILHTDMSRSAESWMQTRVSAESWMQTWVDQPNLECRHASISRILNARMCRSAESWMQICVDQPNLECRHESISRILNADMSRSAESWMQTWVDQPNLECRHESISQIWKSRSCSCRSCRTWMWRCPPCPSSQMGPQLLWRCLRNSTAEPAQRKGIRFSVVDPDPHHFGNLDPHPHQIKSRTASKFISWIQNRIWIHINLQMSSQSVWNISLL